MPSTWTILSLGAVATQANLQNTFPIYDQTTADLSNIDFLNNGGDNLLQSGLGVYYQALLASATPSDSQTIYSYAFPSPSSGVSWPVSMTLVKSSFVSISFFVISIANFSIFSLHWKRQLTLLFLKIHKIFGVLKILFLLMRIRRLEVETVRFPFKKEMEPFTFTNKDLGMFGLKIKRSLSPLPIKLTKIKLEQRMNCC